MSMVSYYMLERQKEVIATSLCNVRRQSIASEDPCYNAEGYYNNITYHILQITGARFSCLEFVVVTVACLIQEHI
jgi:hypothetical protein